MPNKTKRFSGLRCAYFSFFCASAVFGQVPVISPFGVVNSASYTTGGSSGNGIGPGSVAALFGINLAGGTAFPDPLLLSTVLEGTRVTVGGIAAYLMYVSPNQIDFQMPLNISGRTSVVVSTPAGNSLPYPITAESGFGVFTLGTGGCGAAAALNGADDGTLSLNTPSTSVSPGGDLSIFGTGLYPMSPAVPDGALTPSSPLAIYTGAPGGTQFDLDGPVSPNIWVGLAPGLVGVDQVNVPVPSGVREGCAVPLLVFAGAPGSSKPVTVSVRRGGGQCSDPAEAGYGRIQWLKSIIQGDGSTTEIDMVTVSLQASPGKQKPPARSFAEGKASSGLSQNGGAECAVPGYRSLDAGKITVQGPGLAPTDAFTASLGPPEDGQIAGLTQQLAVLPAGAIQPGAFTVTAKGGSDVGAFQSNAQIGPGIQITTALPAGTVLRRTAPLVVNWTGGDSATWVTMKLMAHLGSYEQYGLTQARASTGSGTITPDLLASIPAGAVELEIDVEPENKVAFTPSGLSLGGEHTWKVIYRFTGLTLD